MPTSSSRADATPAAGCGGQAQGSTGRAPARVLLCSGVTEQGFGTLHAQATAGPGCPPLPVGVVIVVVTVAVLAVRAVGLVVRPTAKPAAAPTPSVRAAMRT